MSPKKAGRAALALLCAAALLSGTLVACGGDQGLTVPENGTVYAKYSPDLLTDTGEDYETFTLTVVDYDREAGTFTSRNEVSHTFTLAEGVTVHHNGPGGEDSVIAGAPGKQARSQALVSALLWPSLSSVFYEDSTWLLELHLTDGKVDELGWFTHQNQFPQGDLYDETSGLYYSPEVGAGTVVPEELRGTFSVKSRINEGEGPERSFYDRSGAGTELFRMWETGYSVVGEPDDLKYALGQHWFHADGVQFLRGGTGDVPVYDPVSGVRLTLPGELAEGLVLISARTTAVEIGVSGRRVETDGGNWLVCLHREMLGQISVQQAVANRCGVFALGLMPGAGEPFWSFGWEGRYPWLELSDGARNQCEALLESREAITGSLDTTAAALLAQDWVTGVEYLDLLPAEKGTVAYQNDTFGVTMEFPAETAEHLMAVTMDRGDGWTIHLGETSGAETMDSGWNVTFVDRRLMERFGDEYAPTALAGAWAGRVLCIGEDAPLPDGLDELGSGGDCRYCYVPTLLTEEGLERSGMPVPQAERTAILRTAEDVAAAAKTLTPPDAETRTLLERFAPDGLTAIFDGARDGSGEEPVINWYRLRLAFHFDGRAGVDLENNPLHYQLEFEDDSPLRALIGIEPFTSGGQVEQGAGDQSWALDFTMGSNVVMAADLAQAVAQDPACTLRVTDLATGESRVFPMETRFGGEK